MEEELISIIVPAYNSEKYIEKCLLSVINQTYQNLEIIIVVSPSKDKTLEKIYEFTDSRIIVIQEPKKSTCSTARNIGFLASKGSYITFLDSDDWFEPQRCEIMIHYMKEYPEFNIASHGVFFHKNGNIEINCYPGDDPRCLTNLGGILIRRSILENCILSRGYLFDITMDRLDDGEMMMSIKNEKTLFVPLPYSHYNFTGDGLTSNTNSIRHSLIILKICMKHGRYEYVFSNIKNIIAVSINQIFHCDIVEIRKRRHAK